MKTKLLGYSTEVDVHEELLKKIDEQLEGYDLVYRAPTTTDAKHMVDVLANRGLVFGADDNGEIIINLNVFPENNDGVALSISQELPDGDKQFVGTNALIKRFEFGFSGGGPMDLYDAITENFDLANEEFLDVIKTDDHHKYLNIRLQII